MGIYANVGNEDHQPVHGRKTAAVVICELISDDFLCSIANSFPISQQDHSGSDTPAPPLER